MLNKEKLEQLMAILGDLTGEQKVIVAETLKGSFDEKEIFEKLGVRNRTHAGVVLRELEIGDPARQVQD